MNEFKDSVHTIATDVFEACFGNKQASKHTLLIPVSSRECSKFWTDIFYQDGGVDNDCRFIGTLQVLVLHLHNMRITPGFPFPSKEEQIAEVERWLVNNVTWIKERRLKELMKID